MVAARLDQIRIRGMMDRMNTATTSINESRADFAGSAMPGIEQQSAIELGRHSRPCQNLVHRNRNATTPAGCVERGETLRPPRTQFVHFTNTLNTRSAILIGAGNSTRTPASFGILSCTLSAFLGANSRILSRNPREFAKDAENRAEFRFQW